MTRVTHEEVRSRSGTGDALERLDAALALSQELEAEADALVSHFVDEARAEGHSWSAIGECMGVSKQAARKRFVEAVPSPPGSTPRLVRCLEAAHAEAAEAGAAEMGTEHLLLGLFREGVAAATLERLGLTADATRAAVNRLLPVSGEGEHAGHAESAEATRCLHTAAAMAKTTKGGYVGTEHVLMTIAVDSGSRGRRVLQDLGADFATIKRELACFIAPRRSGGRRRRRKANDGGTHR